MRLLPRFLRFIMLLILSIAVVACARPVHQEPTSLQPQDCYKVTHVGGETCVPQQPKRVVILDAATLEYAIALGIRPIGATLADTFATQLHQDLAGIAEVGKAGEPSLEKILALQPDLILGGDYYESIYPQISQIAPTVLYQFDYSGRWKEVFMQVAQMLRRTEVAQQVMNQYYQRLNDFKQQLGQRLEQIEVSVIRIYPDQINLYLKDSFCGVVLQDAGLQRPAAQNIAASEAETRFDNPIQVSISRELLHQAEGDVMFIWTGENTPEGNQQAQQKLAALKTDPLWQGLNVAQQNQIYLVPSYWIGSGPIAANRVIDDLFKYLVNP